MVHAAFGRVAGNKLGEGGSKKALHHCNQNKAIDDRSRPTSVDLSDNSETKARP